MIVFVSPTFAKSHVAAYTKKDGTFVAEHDDKRKAKVADKPLDPKIKEKFDGYGVKKAVRSFVVKKVGNKWLTVTAPGKTFEMKLAITPHTSHLAVGSQVNDIPVLEHIEKSKFGSVHSYMPIEASAEDAKAIKLAGNKKEMETWLGYLEKAEKEGYLYANAVQKLTELGAEDVPEVKARIDAVKASLKAITDAKEEAKAKAANEKKTATYLFVPYEKKDMAKEAGAKFDGEKKRWYIPAGVEVPPELKKYIDPIAEQAKGGGSTLKPGEDQHYEWGTNQPSSVRSVGAIIKEGPSGTYRKVVAVSKGVNFGDSASSMGGFKKGNYRYVVTTAPATEEEVKANKVATLAAEKAKFEETQSKNYKAQAKGIESALSKQFLETGDRNEKPDVKGDVLYSTANVMGGGSTFMLDNDKIWYLHHNSSDGADFSLNNHNGAIAISLPLKDNQSVLANIKKMAANAQGKPYFPVADNLPKPATPKPTEAESDVKAGSSTRRINYDLFPEGSPAQATNTSSDPWSDEQWSKLRIDEGNSNAKTHHRLLDKMRSMASAGDVDGLKALTHGVNTYGKKRALIAQHLLSAMGHGIFAKSEIGGQIVLTRPMVVILK